MPSFEIDLQSPFAGFQLISIMHWPSDRLARENYLVTTAAQLMQKIEDDLPRGAERGQQEIAAQVAAAVGSSAEDVLVRIRRKAQGQVRAAVSSLKAEVDNQIFSPFGGFSRVATAGGVDAILKDAANQGRKFGGACGEILAYIVMMEEHYPDSMPSYNRAVKIMVDHAKKEGRTIPPERYWTTMWTKWGGISPLWAASIFCETAAKARGVRGNLHDPRFRQEVVSVWLWLADFATTFKAKGAKAMLLLEDKVIRPNCQVKTVKPQIPLLTDEMLASAHAYRAPVPP